MIITISYKQPHWLDTKNRAQELNIEHTYFTGSIRHKERKSIIQYGLTAIYIMKENTESLLKERVTEYLKTSHENDPIAAV